MSHAETWEDTTAKVKEQADIVQIIGEHVTLKRSGVRYLGLCPFHQEKTPSFSVHPGQQYYYCFGCEASGDVFSFLMNYHHLSFPEALKVLAERLHIQLPQLRRSERERELDRHREQLFALNRRAAEIYRRYLLEAPRAHEARSYLGKRGMDADLEQRYLLGYAPSPDIQGWNFLASQLSPEEQELALETGLVARSERGTIYDRFRDRVMFPIFDTRGRITGFGGRILGAGNPKYLNSPESRIYHKSRLLFGLYQQREAIGRQRRAVLVEGNFDVLALVAGGFEPVAAPLGTALSERQVRQLKPLVDEIIILFDGDSAGLQAAERAAGCFLAEQVSARVAVLPPDHDPDTYIREHGAAAVEQLVAAAEPLPEFVAQRLVDRHGLTLAGKTRIVQELRPLLEAAGSELMRSVTAAHFGDILGVETTMLLDQLGPAAAPPAAAASTRPERRTDVAVAELLGGGLKSLVAFMVLNPTHFPALVEAGIQELLAGSAGEIIFLQLKRAYEKYGVDFEPEQLLTGFPEGEERALVTEILLDPQADPAGELTSEHQDEAVEDILSWVRRTLLKRRSDLLMSAIQEADKENDANKLIELMRLKTDIERQIKAAG